MDLLLSTLWWTLGTIFTAILLYFLAVLLLPLIAVNRDKDTSPKTHLAYLHGNGIHVDLIYPIDALSQSFKDSLQIAATARYVAFGWGDQGFYLNTPTWSELKLTTALVAAFVKSPTAMHITDHFEGNTDWRKVPLTADQHTALLTYLTSGFSLDNAGQIIPIPDKGYTDHDRFFVGDGQYTALNTCNTWVNYGLKKVGVKTALWAAHENGLLRHFPESYHPVINEL